MIGVVIVSYNSSDVIFDCLESLLAADDSPARIVIVDNASPDRTADQIKLWALKGERPQAGHDAGRSAPALTFPLDFVDVAPDGAMGSCRIALVRAASNGGYAAGVNLGLAMLKQLSDISLFWILNPDTTVPTGAATAYMEAASMEGDGLLGCRIAFCEPPHAIQSDGGVVNAWTGACTNLNRGTMPHEATAVANRAIDFISGANLMVPKRVLEAVGPMTEDYFLYYEEVDWARRARMLGFKVAMVPGATVFHHGGTVIGSGTLKRSPSPLSVYFNSRNRMRFVRRWMPLRLPFAYVFGLAKVIQMLVRGDRDAAWAGLLGVHGCAPPSKVRCQIAPESWGTAFGRPGHAAPVSSPVVPH